MFNVSQFLHVIRHIRSVLMKTDSIACSMSSMHFEATHSDTSNLMHFSAQVFSITGPPSFQPEIKTSAEYVALVLTMGTQER